jgi:plasmid stability protein
MLRRNANATVQVNLRIKETLRRKLEVAAKEHQVSFNQELTARLEDSLEKETVKSIESAAQSLAQDALRLRSLTNTVVERMGTWPGLHPPQQKQEDGDKS